jgi:phosphatidate cytidylyltransferase
MKRVLTAAAGLPVVLGVTYWGSDWVFASLVALVGALALDEFMNLGALKGPGPGISRPGYWLLALGAGLTLSFLGPPVSMLGMFLLAALLLLMTALGSNSPRAAARRLATGLAGLFYTCLLPGFLILLSPRFAVFVVLGIIWTGDSAAYYAGRRWGQRRLAPRISQGKTVEGAVAGTIASLAVGVGLGGILLEIPYIWLALISLITALAGQAGDLFESALKRSVGIKDSSNRLPGHGGVLDRVDSLLFAAPVFYLLLFFVR